MVGDAGARADPHRGDTSQTPWGRPSSAGLGPPVTVLTPSCRVRRPFSAGASPNRGRLHGYPGVRPQHQSGPAAKAGHWEPCVHIYRCALRNSCSAEAGGNRHRRGRQCLGAHSPVMGKSETRNDMTMTIVLRVWHWSDRLRTEIAGDPWADALIRGLRRGLEAGLVRHVELEELLVHIPLAADLQLLTAAGHDRQGDIAKPTSAWPSPAAATPIGPTPPPNRVQRLAGPQCPKPKPRQGQTGNKALDGSRDHNSQCSLPHRMSMAAAKPVPPMPGERDCNDIVHQLTLYLYR